MRCFPRQRQTTGNMHREGERCRVLVIDDDADIRDSTAMVIRMLGHEVAIAVDGPSGMIEGRAFQPDLVLLDLGLPGADGHDVARAMRAEPWGQRAMLAAVTGRAGEAHRRVAEAAGFDVHVAKPVDLGTLSEMISRAAALQAMREAPASG